MSHSQDDDLFAQAMQHVQPIKKNTKVKTPHKRPSIKSKHASHTHASSPSQYPNQKPEKQVAHHSLKEGGKPWVLLTNGVSPETLKKLAHGQPNITQTLDLHGMTITQALHATEHCLQSTRAAGGRVVCVIHGRGLHSQDGRAILKQSIYEWLRSGTMTQHILAVIPKPDTRGGSCLILLRRDKSLTFGL